ncbi:MAG: NAD(P)H-quinone oxidoreductase subunit F [Aphanocapsa sp. GSE-SYN-MK-11-07L]|jgi:NAD(P)H-quinone oxidoreductase subunit 5|nr:NAD(P)H-quinone oxidoreductase subunit F [Aphanocapsa sp. GSE-SYN-MK-11-07L]
MFQTLVDTIWLVPCYAFLGALISFLWFPSIIRKTGPRPSGYINTLMSLTALLHSVLAFSALQGQPAQRLLIPWLKVANLDLTIPIEVSSLTMGALVLIMGINLFAQVFAIGYMEMDWGWARFFSLLALFEAGMSALVLLDSLFFSYMVLEILTLATYLLTGLWFNQPLVVTGARDAFLTKRVGDLFLLMGVLALLPLAGTWDYQELATWAKTAQVDPTVMTLVGLALIAGPMGKCAQFPLHLWLDEAMEGPIPASILRNSIVVATGAWVLFKLEPVLALSPFTLSALIWIGGVTAVGGTLIAIAQIDIKRSLSYLVSAYMGIVFIAIGTQQTAAAQMMTLTHALAMALLVMSVGAVIWNCITQDLRQYGGLFARRPISGLSFMVGAAGLVAFPPLGGFWALLKLVDGLWTTQPWLVGLLVLVNTLAGFSLARVFCMVWGGSSKPMTARSPEVFWPMILPAMTAMGFTLHLPHILATLSLLPTWETFNQEAALLLTGSSVLGFSAAGLIYLSPTIQKPVKLPLPGLQDLFAYDFYTPKLYKTSIVFGVDLISQLTSWFDKYLIDGTGNLFGLATIFSGQSLKYSTSGQSQFYVLTILVGIATIGVLLCWPVLSHLSLAVG